MKGHANALLCQPPSLSLSDEPGWPPTPLHRQCLVSQERARAPRHRGSPRPLPGSAQPAAPGEGDRLLVTDRGQGQDGGRPGARLLLWGLGVFARPSGGAALWGAASQSAAAGFPLLARALPLVLARLWGRDTGRLPHRTAHGQGAGLPPLLVEPGHPRIKRPPPGRGARHLQCVVATGTLSPPPLKAANPAGTSAGPCSLMLPEQRPVPKSLPRQALESPPRRRGSRLAPPLSAAAPWPAASGKPSRAQPPPADQEERPPCSKAHSSPQNLQTHPAQTTLILPIRG